MVVTERTRFPEPPPGDVFSAEEWCALEAAIDGRPGAIQLRDKDLAGGPLLRRAERLAARCRDAGVKLLVNGRVDVAAAACADGVHLPADGLPPSEARRLLPPSAIIGRSIHDPAEIEAAGGADFLLFGPIFDTPSKRPYGLPPQGLRRLAEVCARAPLPIVAVGGIGEGQVADVRQAGAAGVALIAAVLAAPDPRAAVRRLIARLAG